MTAALTYYVFHIGLAWLKSRVTELKARLTGKAFYCKALNGRGHYNISVNSDMSVSCSCQDRNGSGWIGDMNTQTFEEIFAGPTATKFRQQLASGVLPTTWCINCCDLHTVPKKAAAAQVLNWKLPSGGVMVENTALCNLACTSCYRAALYKTRGAGKRMTLSQLTKVAETLGRLKFKLIAFFKIGEPFLSPTVGTELRIIREHNPDATIVCSTAGSGMNTPEKVAAALYLDLVIFSIDGIDTPMCQKYQKGQNFDKAFNSMAALVKLRNSCGLSRPLVCWKYVVFRWNDKPEYIETAKEMARAAGVDYIILSPTSSPVWGFSWRARLLRYYKTVGQSHPLGIIVPICCTTEHAKFMEELGAL